MADLPSYKAKSALGIDDNPNLTKAINGFANDWWPPSQSLGSRHEFYGPTSLGSRSATPVDNPSYKARSFFDDFYNRIYVVPETISLGTLTDEATAEINVWNAYPRPVNLASVSVMNDSDISISGPSVPTVYLAMAVRTYVATVGMSGSYDIDAQVYFNFSDADDPPYVLIVGNRGILFGDVPEAPVTEYWDFVTDRIVSVNGTEQRISLLTRPKRSIDAEYIIDNKADILKRAQLYYGRQTVNLVVPYYQYATNLTAPVSVGNYEIEVDASRSDLRNGEAALITDGVTFEIVSVETVGLTLNGNGANDITLSRPLNNTWAAGAKLVPCFISFVNDKPKISRYSTQNVGTMSNSLAAVSVRDSLSRPGSSTVFTEFDSMLVLDKRPLANDNPTDEYNLNVVQFGNDISAPGRLSRWDYAKIRSEREFIVRRIHKPAEMDYWRDFAQAVKGGLISFLAPTFRDDLILVSVPIDGAGSLEFVGPEYVRDFSQYDVFSRLYIQTESGVVMRKIVSSEINVSGNSVCTLDSAMPVGSGYRAVSCVSFLLRVKLSSDRITLEHHGLETFVKLHYESCK